MPPESKVIALPTSTSVFAPRVADLCSKTISRGGRSLPWATPKKAPIFVRDISGSPSTLHPILFRRAILRASAASVSLILAIFGAYALSRLQFKGRHIIQRSILFVYMVGGVLLMVPLYQMSVIFGLAQTIWGSLLSLLLIYIIQTLPVSLLQRLLLQSDNR